MGGEVADFLAHRGADDFAAAAGEVRNSFFQPHEHLGAPAGGKAVGFAGHGVGIMHIGAQPQRVGSLAGGQAGEAAHAQHHVCLFAADEIFAAHVGAEQLPEETRHAQREGGGLGNGRNAVEFEVAVFAGGFGIHLLAGDEQHRVVPHFAELLGHGNAGEEVAACATAGDDDVERFFRVHEFWISCCLRVGQ